MTRAALCGCVPALLGAFDFGFLALAGPRIAPDLGVAGAIYPWLFSSSSFAYGAAVMPAAALTARLGPPRALAVGLAGVAAGAGTLAVASGPALTLAARVLTGIGGALAATAAIALLASIGSDDDRRRAFAALGGAVALGFAAGALTAALPSWRLAPAAAALTALATAHAALRLRDASRADEGAVRGVASRGGWFAARGAATSRGSTSRRRRFAARDGTAATLPRAGGVTAPPLRGAAGLTAAIVCVAVGGAAADAGAVWAVVALGLAPVLAAVALRRATTWLPERRSALGGAAFAGAATTASGVGATILIAPALTAADLPGALLGVFGLAVVPGSRLTARLTRRAGASVTAAAGLGLQAAGLTGTALVLTTAPDAVPVAAALLLFGIGHVVANGGAAAAVAGTAGPRAPQAAALLIAAQYVGGGCGSLVMVRVAAGQGAVAGILTAAAIAIVGAAPIAARRSRLTAAL